MSLVQSGDCDENELSRCFIELYNDKMFVY